MNDKTQYTYLTQTSAKFVSGFYIIGSIGANGVSFATQPMLHRTHQDAVKECERLARNNPGKMFMPVQFQGAAYHSDVSWT